jgi:tetratricopeptide (TPR) repeat protein
MTTNQQSGSKDSKTVFALRKDGRLEEALAMGRELYDSSHVDVWVVRSLGWVLLDLAKLALKDRDREKAALYFKDLDALTFGPDDSVLVSQRDWLRQQFSLGGEILARARAAGKAGHYDDAIALYREAVKSMPESGDAQNGLGWEIDRLLKEEAAKPEPNRLHVIALVREYLRLPHVEKPSLIHSMILTRVLHLQGCLEQLYASFIKKWDPKYLRDEDYLPYKPEGKDETYPSLAEKAGMALGKAIKGIKRDSIPEGVDPQWISRWLGELAARFPDQIWLQYHHAKSLLLAGDPDTARKEILPIVRAKQSEFWVWSVLADTFASGSGDRLACLCRALLCKVQDAVYLSGVLRNLKAELESSGEHEATTRLANHKPQDSLPLLVNDIAPVLNKYAPVANQLAFDDIPWADAVVSGRVPPKADIKGAVFLTVRTGDRTTEMRVGYRKFACLENAAVGAPMAVRTVIMENRKMVVDARVRNGQPWDLIPEHIGVVTGLNLQKELTAISLGEAGTTLAYFDRFPLARDWRPGDSVAVRYQHIQKDALPILVSVRRTDDVPSASFCRPYAGTLRLLDNGVTGFVGDIYVTGSVIKEKPESGMACHGVAVLDRNPKTGKKSWRALTFQITQ